LPRKIFGFNPQNVVYARAAILVEALTIALPIPTGSVHAAGCRFGLLFAHIREEIIEPVVKLFLF
jgi:hypothetical protein